MSDDLEAARRQYDAACICLNEDTPRRKRRSLSHLLVAVGAILDHLEEQELEPFSCAVLNLEPGDKVILRAKRPITQQQAAALRQTIDKNWPGVPALVISDEIEPVILAANIVDTEGNPRSGTVTITNGKGEPVLVDVYDGPTVRRITREAFNRWRLNTGPWNSEAEAVHEYVAGMKERWGADANLVHRILTEGDPT